MGLATPRMTSPPPIGHEDSLIGLIEMDHTSVDYL